MNPGVISKVGWVWSSGSTVLNRTVVVVDSDWRFDHLCGSHLQSQSELYHVSWWYYTLVIGLIIIIWLYSGYCPVIQGYVHPDDQTQPTFEMTPGFKPFTEFWMLYQALIFNFKYFLQQNYKKKHNITHYKYLLFQPFDLLF